MEKPHTNNQGSPDSFRWQNMGSAKYNKEATYSVNQNGDVSFVKFGEIISLGKTRNTRRVDAYPYEDNESYHSSVVGIETYDGNTYLISEGILVDTRNDKKLDILKKRDEDPDFSFPNLMIGYKFPYDKLSDNFIIPKGEGGTIVKIVCYGAGSTGNPNDNELKKKIQKRIHGIMLENEDAKRIRHIK